MVREKFKKYGAIKDVYLPIDYYTKEPKGFGFVEFYNPSDAEQALKEMNGLELDGNKIDVFVAQRGRSNPRDGYSPMRRTSRDYRVSSPKYRDRRRHDKYSRSSSRRSSRNRYEHKSKRSRRDNSSYNRSR
uniref:RRM domain-containing protein n=1 Tax=Piliocolobus tephrosceles TaxID=591936 RepID=A0A8C9GRT9_9PRIM